MTLSLWIIAIGVSLNMVIFGIDQMRHPEGWFKYLPPWLQKISPIPPVTQMRFHAAGNIIFGILLASGFFPLTAAWIAFIWYLTILPFAFYGNWKVGLRDFSITLSLVALLLLL